MRLDVPIDRMNTIRAALIQSTAGNQFRGGQDAVDGDHL